MPGYFTPSFVSGAGQASASSYQQTESTDSTAATSSTTGTDVDTVSRPAVLYKKRFTSSWAKKRSEKDGDEGARGPLGLRLLQSSPEPLIDLIFVHGLRGGSIKTWRKGSDPRYFWPQFWLPNEPGFHNTNIHSFGYDSDWASTKSSILNVHDFGQSLLEEMRNSPYLRENHNCPIILVGHSMGGLVIKKAFTLARDVPDFKDRIRCIFFLATPHRGSDYAAVLNNILTASGVMSSRHYIADLTTGSTSTELINNDFGRYANDLQIFSFYETLRMNLGISSTLIVEKGSAILGSGFKNERAQYLNANHRDICKFDSVDDPNYITLKNALASAIQHLSKDVIVSRNQSSKEHVKMLESFLGIWDQPDEHYLKVNGSCEWIDAREDYQDWRDPAEELVPAEETKIEGKNPSFYWVHANPGTGKTFLAAHVVAELQEFKLDCSSHFFHVGNKASRSLANFLRSMAYQMAVSNALIREKLISLVQEGVSLDVDDSRTVWTKIFKRGIFQTHLHTPQYWVIDAVDECSKYQEFFTMIKGERPNFPLRIFVTSRKIPDMQRLHRPLEATASITCIEIPIRASLDDIERYVHSRIENLPIDAAADRQELAKEILHRSSACFLWVRLVLDELELVYSHESILQVLRSIPEGMIPYYERTIGVMSENKMEKHIAKAVLIWAVASCRDLSILELSQALKLDINTVLPSAKSAVEGLCGQLVSVEHDTGVVYLVHPTAREFLLSDKAGEFSVSKPEAHERIALACLKLLSSPEIQPPRNRRLLTQRRDHGEPSPFLDYALTQFSEHIQSASSGNDALLVAIDRFFRTNVLSWIERISQKGDLHCIIRTSKNLRAYLDRRAKYLSPLSSQVRNVDSWSMDLSRVVAKFGRALLQNPSSIYFLVPPLCPTGSAIHQQFGRRPDGLAVMGFHQAAWDDCIVTMTFGEDSIASAVSCGESFIGVGMESGKVNLYNHRGYQKERVFDLKYPIDLIHFTAGHVVACTIRFIILQDLQGRTIWQKRLRSRCILLTSADNFILAISQNGHLLKWNVTDGTLLDDQVFPYRSYNLDLEPNENIVKAPSLATISPDMEMLALGYRGGTVCLWELQSGEIAGWAQDEEDKLASVLLFNPNPNIGLLLVIYTNHDLSLYDAWSGNFITTHKTNGVGPLSASCSPDGRTLATTDTQGNIQIWDFESLTLLYHVWSPPTSFRILSFTSGGSSIADVSDSGMRIWSPASLVRKNTEEDNSVSDDAVQLAVIEGQYETLRTSRITALCSHPSLPIVFAGKFNGDVIAFNTRSGQYKSTLYAHTHFASITTIVVNKANIIASTDVHNTIQVWNLHVGQSSTVTCGSLLFQVHLPTQIHQSCFSPKGDYLLIATKRSDQVYSTKTGLLVGTLDFEPNERKAWHWVYPTSGKTVDQFILINNHKLQRFSIPEFPSKVDNGQVHLHYELPEGSEEAGIDSAVICDDTLVLDIHVNSGYVSSSTMFLFNISGTSKASEEFTTLKPLSDVLPTICKRFIGVSDRTKTILFLHKTSWLCSINPNALAENHYMQHFFVPNEYVSTSSNVHPVRTADDNVVFCLHGELAVVKNGLNFQEAKPLE